jgi:hypothetical protein
MKIASILWLLLFAIPSLAEARLYTIREGDHASTPRVVRFFSGTKMKLSFVFDSSAFYQLTGAAASDQLDTSKLYGFSDCKSRHSENSARLGWRNNQGKIEIMTFTHRGGKFYYEVLTTVEPDRVNQASIALSEDRKSYIYEVNGVRASVERGCDDPRAIGYALQPYFGGNRVAPQEIRIRVDVADEVAPVMADVPYPTVLNGGAFKMKVDAEEGVGFFVRLYDLTGRKTWESPRDLLEPGAETVMSYQVTESLQSGMYLLVPYATTKEGVELRAALSPSVSGDAYRVFSR